MTVSTACAPIGQVASGSLQLSVATDPASLAPVVATAAAPVAPPTAPTSFAPAVDATTGGGLTPAMADLYGAPQQAGAQPGFAPAPAPMSPPVPAPPGGAVPQAMPPQAFPAPPMTLPPAAGPQGTAATNCFPMQAPGQQPVQQVPVQQAPVQQAPVQQAPVQQLPVQQVPVQQVSMPMQVPVQQPVQQAPVLPAPPMGPSGMPSPPAACSCACCCGKTGAQAITKKPARPAPEPAAPVRPKKPKPATGVTKAEIRKWVRGDTAGLNSGLVTRLAKLGKKLGQPISIQSGKRSFKEQTRLYNLYKAGRGNLAARPGTSRHESGNAADASIGGVNLASYKNAKAEARKLGLGFPVAGEAWHVEVL